MDIACPNCAATYRVPDALIDGANALRCVACGHAWVPEPPRPAEAEAPLAVAKPPPPPLPPVPVAAPALPDLALPDLAPPDPAPPDPAPPDPASAAPAPPVDERPPAAPPAPPPLPRSETTVTLTPTRVGPPHLARRRLPEGTHRRPAAGRALSAAWAVSIALVIVLVLGLALYHRQISEAWPPFARIAG